MELDFAVALARVQEHISKTYPEALTVAGKQLQLQSYIENYLRNHEISVPGWGAEELTNRFYSDMVEYSVLTPFLNREDVEEINVNGWDDIAITYTDGHVEKALEHFISPGSAVDVIKRLLQHSKMIIDDAMPMTQGHLPGNSRIAVLKSPLMDNDRLIGASIRLLHPSKVTYKHLIAGGCTTQKMIDFLCACLNYGVPFVIAGATSAGKTTLLNALLRTVPDDKRIFTIETGARELTLLRRADGAVCNNVVHTLSRPNDDARYEITQEDLVLAALRFNPDVIVVGEMRDVEAFAAVEACLTGHTVVSTIHSTNSATAHLRLGQLCQKRFPADITTAKRQAAQAFPLVIYVHKGRDNVRRIMDISECVVCPDGNLQYRTLFKFSITKNEYINDTYVIDGHFEQPDIMSRELQERLIMNGIPQKLLYYFLEREGSN